MSHHSRVVSALVMLALGGVAVAAPGVRLVGHKPSWANKANDRGTAAGGAIRLTVHVARPADKQRAFHDLLAAQYTPGSPSFHQWLTPAQIGERFGADDGDIAATTTWLRQQGFTVTRVSNAKTAIEVTGTTAIAARAFGVELHEYAVDGKTLLALDREPTIPTQLASIVTSVHGLVEHDVRPQHVMGKPGHARRPLFVDSNGDHFTAPSDFSTIYDLGPASATLDGTGQVIGVIGVSAVLPADVTSFNALLQAHVPLPVVVIPPDGTDPGPPCGDPTCLSDSYDGQIEATLDVTRSGSIAPGAKVETIVSGGDGVDIGLDYAIDQYTMPSDANIINLSFGLCEDYGGSEATEYDNLYQQAAMQGQSVFVSAGDSAAAGCQPQGGAQDPSQPLVPSVNVLGSSSYVTCMGGTEFADLAAQSTYWDGSGNAMGYIPEGAWNEASSLGALLQLGGGGGESHYIAKPDFQNGLGSATSKRLVPDASFNSADYEGYVLCTQAIPAGSDENGPGVDCGSDSGFSFNAVGGTSAAAPDMAGVAALIDQSVGASQGNLNPTLYMLASDPSSKAFHDVTVASSGVTDCNVTTPSLCNNSDPGSDDLSTGGTPGYLVGSGYDEATGLGTPDIAQLISHWPGAALPMLVIDPTSTTVSAGQRGTVALEPSGFTGPITYACSSNLPYGATCSFRSSELLIDVPLGGAAGVVDTGSGDRSLWWLVPGGLALLVVMRHRRRRFAIAVTAFALATSCGGGSNSPAVDAAPPQTVTVTVTATSGGAETASAPLQLTVD